MVDVKRQPSFITALGVFTGIVVILITGIFILKTDLHVLLVAG
jgi:hypothetical protein